MAESAASSESGMMLGMPIAERNSRGDRQRTQPIAHIRPTSFTSPTARIECIETHDDEVEEARVSQQFHAIFGTLTQSAFLRAEALSQ